MDAPMHALSTAALARANEANLWAFWEIYGSAPQCEFSSDPHMIRFTTGLPSEVFNGIVYARLDDGDPAPQLAAALAPFEARGLPMLWWVGPSSEPAHLAELLAGYGLSHIDDVPGMAIDLLALREDLATRDDLTVVPACDIATLGEWLEVASTGFEIPRPVVGALFELEVGIGYAADLPLRRYVARLRATPVATATLFLGAGVAGIYSVTTLPAARRQGIGTALTLALLREARALGYRVGILQSSEMGASVYQQIGFQSCCTFRQYRWPGAAAGDEG